MNRSDHPPISHEARLAGDSRHYRPLSWGVDNDAAIRQLQRLVRCIPTDVSSIAPSSGPLSSAIRAGTHRRLKLLVLDDSEQEYRCPKDGN